MSDDLRYILNFPLCARDFSSTVNLFNGRFNSARANRTNLFSLIILIIDDTISMFFKVKAEILSLFERAISKGCDKRKLCACNRIIYFALSQKTFDFVYPLHGTANLMEVFHQMKPVKYFTSL